MDAIVLATAAFAFAFFAAWLLSPALRTWIERPKLEFQTNLERFDRARHSEAKQ